MRFFAVPYVLIHFVFSAEEGLPERVLASKCCPDGFALVKFLWSCIPVDEDEREVPMKVTDDTGVTTLASREGVTEGTETRDIGDYSFSTHSSQNNSATDVTDGGLRTYNPQNKDISDIQNTTSNAFVNPDSVNRSGDSFVEINGRNDLRKEESLTDLFARHPKGVRWLPAALHNTSRRAWSSLVVRYAGIDSLTCFDENGTWIKSSQTHRYRLADNGSFVLLSPTTRNRTSETVFSPLEYCMDVAIDEEEIVFIVCPCRRVQCVSKCCQENEAFVCDDSWKNCDCAETNGGGWDPFEYERAIIPKEITYEMLSGNVPTCGEGEELYAYPPSTPYHNSRFWVGYPRGWSYAEELVCVDRAFVDTSPTQYLTMISCGPSVDALVYDLLHIAQAPAAALLTVALVVSVLLPAPAKSAFGWAHRWALPCHAATLLAANATRTVTFLIISSDICRIFNYISFWLNFCQVAASFWLNVMCINLAWGFSLRQGTRSSNKSRTKIFILYSAYAWGCSVALTGFTTFMWFSPNVPSFILRPSLTETRACHDEFMDGPGKLSSFSYYYGPMGGLLTINIALCVFIIKRMQNMKKGTECLRGNESDVHQDTSASRKSMFLYVKLLSLVGIVEIVIDLAAWGVSSNFSEEFYSNVISSFMELARALSIFVLCCCNKRMLRLIQAGLRIVKLSLLNCAEVIGRKALYCLRERESEGTTTSLPAPL